MCLLITAVVPNTARSDSLTEVVRRHRLNFSPCENPVVKAQLSPSERYVCATGSVCDCGSPLFFGRSTAGDVEKLRKKKWSEAKIKQWLKATEARPRDPNAPGGVLLSLDDWAAFLDEALRLPGVPYLGIIGHWYKGGVSTDEFTLTRRVRHTVSELREGHLGLLERDVIYEFGSRP